MPFKSSNPSEFQKYLRGTIDIVKGKRTSGAAPTVKTTFPERNSGRGNPKSDMSRSI